MSIFYVKVINGIVVDGPNPLSSSESESPNVNWGPEQLRLNNFYLVDLEHDENTQVVDFTNPTITKDGVSYPILDLPNSQRIVKTNQSIDINRRREYPSTEEMVVALWEKFIENRPEQADLLQQKRIQVKAKYPKVNR